MKLRRDTEAVTCPGCNRLEEMPVEIVFSDGFSVWVCDTCLGKLHRLLDEAKGEEHWGLPMGALS